MKPSLPTCMKTAFTGLLLVCAFATSAQTVTKPVKVPADLYVTADPAKGTSTNTGSTLFCSETANFKLKSSTSDGNGNNYTGYTWEEQQTGTATFGAVSNGSAAQEVLTITGATPGWHTYRVTAVVSGNACPPEPTLYNVYVLPKLVVTATSNKSDAASHTYCAGTGAPTGTDAITFTGTVAFDVTPNALTGLDNLTVDDFEITYTWTKINVATNASTTVATTKDYTIVEAATPGATAAVQYRYELTAVYSVKSCGTYKGTGTLNGSTTTATVTVTPQPGKPVITIE